MDVTTSIALVHDWLITLGGSERVLAALSELWPTAMIHTLVYDHSGPCAEIFGDRHIETSFIQRLPFSKRNYRLFLPLMPLAIEQFDLRRYDIVVSSSHAIAKGILTTPEQLHISYVHTPLRYGWTGYFDYFGPSSSMTGPRTIIAKLILHYLRIWDVIASNRVDVFVANSKVVSSRIWHIYRRRSRVIHPPVDIHRFTPSPRREDYYVTMTRLVPYKRVDLIVEAFSQLGLPLVVVGDGPERGKIMDLAKPNVTFVGWQPDDEVESILCRAKAFVFAANEDFGITLVEAQAAGCPVIAYSRGGASETVIEGKTGIFFHEQTVESLIEAVLEFERSSDQFHMRDLRSNAERFSTEIFKRKFDRLVCREYEAKFGRGAIDRTRRLME